MSDHWTDLIVGDRMTVDQEFADQVEASQFSRQQWGLVMTAVDFEIENPAEPEAARLVAVTDDLPAVLPELDRVTEATGGVPGAGASDSGGGFVDAVKGALGITGGDDGGDEERRADAERLTQAYAEELQAHLESGGRWAEVCDAAADQ
ncbi:MAG: DUF5799 family protein [Haloarculaceae archaeon]